MIAPKYFLYQLRVKIGILEIVQQMHILGELGLLSSV